MQRWKRYLSRTWLMASLLAVLTVMTAAPVLADTVSATGNLTSTFTGSSAGTLLFTVVVNGHAQDVTSSGPILTASDFNSGGPGWNIQMTAAQFTAPGSLTLGTNALSLTSVPNGTCTPGVDNSQCSTTPTNTVSVSGVSPLTLTDGSAVQVYSTTSGTGSYDITPAFRLHIPATAKVASYSSTLTIAYTAGP